MRILGGVAPYIATGLEIGLDAYSLGSQDEYNQYMTIYSMAFSLISLVGGGFSVTAYSICGELFVYYIADIMAYQIFPAIECRINDAFCEMYDIPYQKLW